MRIEEQFVSLDRTKIYEKPSSHPLVGELIPQSTGNASSLTRFPTLHEPIPAYAWEIGWSKTQSKSVNVSANMLADSYNINVRIKVHECFRPSLKRDDLHFNEVTHKSGLVS